MADEANKPNQPRPEEIPTPAQDGMINTKPDSVPAPPESKTPETSSHKPVPPPQGHVDDEAAVDVKTAGSLENPPPAGQTPGPIPDPTVAQLDKSHESELDQAVQELKTQEETAKEGPTPKKKQNNVLLAAVVAILVTMLLVGIGFAAWQASNSNEEAQQTGQDSDQTTEDAFGGADADELEQELDQLDGDFQQLETELDETEFDDETLGL